MIIGILKGCGVALEALLPIAAGTILLFFASLRKFRLNQGAHAAEVDSPESKRAGRIFNAVNAIQWTLVFVVSVVLLIFKHPEWIIPSIIFIVGIHFFPLAVAFKVSHHYFTGAAMMLLAVI